ncbi:hypothetical protein JM18_000559 [Phytophthora kernoviae]|uniref:Uncharacterized protein n=2 Tax=Phytophthora kernoviae TaxID=325452 RepID=A0A922ASQ5_9STRA|nr:hypothetical protein G195_001258 [Phytophthora kernoviae 00238/432]KAG2533228.1 hypothetical protein JM18_000559 [Phytophthora kernoviae]
MPTLMLTLQEEKTPVHLPTSSEVSKPPIKPRAKGKEKAQAKQPITKPAKPADTGVDTGSETPLTSEATPPKSKRGRKRLLHDEGQRRARHMVSQGATSDGVEALLLQLKRYSSYHAISEPRPKTLRVLHTPTQQLDEHAEEQTLSWIVEAKGNWTLRLSRDSLMLVYPHVLKHHDALAQRIVGQTIEPEFTAVFHFNAQAKVTKLESNVDFAGALLQLLGNAKDVATLLEGALISPFGELGMDLQGAMAESALTRGSKQLSLKYILL